MILSDDQRTDMVKKDPKKKKYKDRFHMIDRKIYYRIESFLQLIYVYILTHQEDLL